MKAGQYPDGSFNRDIGHELFLDIDKELVLPGRTA